MCAIVPLTPVVVTEPLTAPSSAMRKLPLPLASVFTAGTSSAPVRVTLLAPLPGIQSGMLEQAPSVTADAITAAFKTVWFMVFLLEDRNTGAARIFLHAGHRCLVGAQALSHSRPVARARRPELRAPVLGFRRRRDQDRVAARHGSEREHGWPAPRAGHAEPAPQQTGDDAQPQAARRQGRLPTARKDGRRGGGELPARRQVPVGY